MLIIFGCEYMRLVFGRTVKNIFTDTLTKLEWRRLHGRPRHRWKNNIKMDLSQDRDRWWAIVNMARNLRVLWGRGWISWLAEQLLASQEGLCFMQLL
jgi:hypothetical protein